MFYFVMGSAGAVTRPGRGWRLIALDA